MNPARFLALALFLLAAPRGQAALLYLYDFPGSPGSGLASAQTNPQPANATFSDFTRLAPLGVVTSSSGVSVYGTNNWSTSTSIDLAQYEGFSITSSTGFVLNLTSLDFLASRSATGPANGRVSLFLNGSAVPYASFDYAPPTSSTPFTFSFTPLTSANNVTSAEFRFYGWNSGGPGGSLYLDNVGTNGAIGVSAVPEMSALLPLLALLGAVGLREACRRRRTA